MPDISSRAAKRFSLHLPLRYRRTDSLDWHRGHSVNISASGVLFRCRRPLDRMTPVEVVLPLPKEFVGESTVRLLCSGYVARVEEPRLPLLSSNMAASFTNYRLLYEDPEHARRVQQLAPPSTQSPAVHSLYNQLAIVIGNSELILAEQNVSDEVLERAARIKEAGDRIASMARDLR